MPFAFPSDSVFAFAGILSLDGNIVNLPVATRTVRQVAIVECSITFGSNEVSSSVSVIPGSPDSSTSWNQRLTWYPECGWRAAATRGAAGRLEESAHTSPSIFKRLILRAVLRNVSPMVIRILAVPDSFCLFDFNEVFLAVLGWDNTGFVFRVHGQEFNSFRRASRPVTVSFSYWPADWDCALATFAR